MSPACHRRAPSGRHKDCGFTLVEALVVLTIAAVCIALIPAALRVGTRLIDIATTSDTQTRNQAALLALQRRLAATRPVFATTADGLPKLLFSGDADRVQFVTAQPAGPSAGGLYMAELRLAPHGPDGQPWLELAMSPHPAGDAAQAEADRTPLIPAKVLALRYFGFDSEQGRAAWQDRWPATDRLPALIEISVDGMTPLVAALRMAQAGGS